ncbi:hypothetical protein OH76DRAFT_1402468 [Lentinus brumalis]|uniref:Uncharacterized protein n=1 Tax=Lentinus brumalis TaxID=2498619 RepID=A0A371DD10_9APHY|nr:hypothetical protein OH76DRAFT_1402468 [Polyporus brumalis]
MGGQVPGPAMEPLGCVLAALLSYRVYIVAPELPNAHLTASQAYARYLRLGLGKSFFLGQKHL